MNIDACVTEFPPDLHERAEEAVRQDIPNLEQMSPEQLHDLIHELRVSRAERDLQNEALRTACEEKARQVPEALSLLENSPDGIVRLDRDLRIRYANPVFARLIATSEEQAVGHTPSELEIPKDLASAMESKARSVFDTGKEAALEFEYTGTEGKRCYHARFVTERYEGTVLTTVLATAHDVTDLVETREKLRENAERYRIVSELVSDYAYSFRIEPSGSFTIEWVTEAFENITGYTPEDANVQGNWTRIIHPDDQETDRQRLESLLAGKENRCQLRIVAKNGDIHWIQDNARPIKDEQGRTVRVIGAAADISDLKRAEGDLRKASDELEEQVWRRTVELEKTITNLQNEIAERKQAEQTIRENEKLLSTVLDTLPVGVMVLDREGKVIRINPASQHIWGKTKYDEPNEFGKFKGWRTTTGEFIPADQWAAARSLRTGATILDEEIEIEDFEGNRKIILNSADPLRDESGNIYGVIMVNEDITDRKMAERELQDYREHLEQLVAERTLQLKTEIEERKQIEAALRESEEQLNAFFEQVPAAMGLLNEQLRFEKVNMPGAQYIGFTADEITGKRFADFIPEFAQKAEQNFRRILNTGIAEKNIEISGELPGRPGEIVHWLSSVFPIDMPGGTREIGIVAVDITQRKRAEAELLRSQKLLQDIMDGAPAMIFLKDLDGRFIIINHLLEELLGRTREEMRGKTDYDIFPDERADYYREHDRKVMESGIPEQLEEEADLADGKRHVFLANKFPLYDEKGKIYGVCSISIDITERKNVENALRSANDHIEAIMDALPDILFEVDRHGLIYRSHVPDPEKLHTQMRDFRGHLTREVLPPKAADIIMEAVETASETRLMKGLIQSLEISGEKTWFEFSIVAIGEPREPDARFIVLAHDITGRKRTEEQARQYAAYLRRQTAQLAAANKELETFSYSISHDLRAPLRSIDGFSLALEEDYSDNLDEQGRDNINRIRTAAQRMAQLIEDLLNLSRTTSAELHYTTVNLSEQAQSVVEELRRAEPERNVEVIIQEGMSVEGDEALLRQVLQNLLGNAWKFTAHQEVARIEFGEKGEEGRRIFFVRDNGAGFDMQYAENLFVPFRRLHSETEFAGTGIGLSIVKRIIDRHGGSIWAESEPGKGAAFYFTLGE